MSMMKLFGGPSSPFARKVLLVLMRKGLLERVDLVRISPPASPTVINPGLLALNPLGRVPVLEMVGERTLFESDLICEFLDERFDDPRIVPSAGTERWQVLEWNALATGGLTLLVQWRGEMVRPPALRSSEFIATCDAKLDAILAAMDAALPDLQAAPFGLAHIAWGSFLGYLDFRFADREWRRRWPGGIDWGDALLARPDFRATAPDQSGVGDSADLPVIRWRE